MEAISVAASLITILLFVSSVYGFIRGSKKNRFSYYTKSNVLIQSGKKAYRNLIVQYTGHSIDKLVATQVALWYSGKDVINGQDMVKTKPLELKISDEHSKILDASIVARTDIDNDFKIIDRDDSQVVFSFDYANPNDGIVAEIIHTGDIGDIKFQYKIKGGEPPKEILHDKPMSEDVRKKVRLIAIITAGTAALSVLLLTVLISFDLIFYSGEAIASYDKIMLNNWGYIILPMMVLASIMMIGVFYTLLSREILFRVPSELRKSIN